MTGRVFGKEIYEISYTDDLQSRLEDDCTGYSYMNSVVYQIDFDSHDPVYTKNRLHDTLSKYTLSHAPFYKLDAETAIKIIESNMMYHVFNRRPLQRKEAHSLRRPSLCCF